MKTTQIPGIRVTRTLPNFPHAKQDTLTITTSLLFIISPHSVISNKLTNLMISLTEVTKGWLPIILTRITYHLDLAFPFISITISPRTVSTGPFVLPFCILLTFDSFIHLLLTQVVSVVLENYGDSQTGNAMRLYSWRMIVNDRGEVNVPT